MEARDPLPYRSGPPPETIGPRPHAQVSQNSPPALHRELGARALELPGVQPAVSLVSVPSALAFVLDGSSPVAWAATATALLVSWKHRANLARVAQGRENRLGARP